MNAASFRYAAALSAVAVFAAAAATAADATNTTNAANAANTALERAIEPLESGVPEVAIVKLRERLAAPLDPAQEKAARKALVQALLAAGRPGEALAECERSGVPPLDAPLLEARANAALGKWEKALALYGAVLEAHPGGKRERLATLGKAESLHALHRLPEAIATLESALQTEAEAQAPNPDPGSTVRLRLAEFYLEGGALERCSRLLASLRAGTPAAANWKHYVEARLLLAQDRPAAALEHFESLQRDPSSTPGLTINLVTGALLGMSDSRARLSGLTTADDLLEEFIWRYPENPRLGEVFARLDAIYAGEENASDSELEKWAAREPEERAGFAAYYLARAKRRAGKPERALRALEDYPGRFPRHPLLAAALRLRGELLGEAKQYAQAQKALEAAMRASRDPRERAEIEMASATVSFQQGEYVLAATVFRAAGEHAPALWERALFNSALSWLHQGNLPRFLADYRELSARLPGSRYRRELILEEGLLQARQGPAHAAEAEATLREFLHDFGDNPRAAEARIALAELRFAGNDAQGASRILQAVNRVGAEESPASAPSPQARERADYLALFLADAADAAKPRDDAKVIALCQAFLEHYPQTARRAEVWMKLGQVCFRTGDFAGAQTQFETLVRESPASPLVEAAYFLAGQASMKQMSEGAVDRAIELFEEVAKINGPLKFHARLQQAVAYNRLGKQTEAISLYDAILRGEPPAEIRFAALAGKAANLAELGEKDRALSEQALDLYTHLAAEPDLGAPWRSQALCEKGRLLETLERPEEALAAYYDVLAEGLAHPGEYYWFYKAGFDAGRLCEARSQWKSAIAVYRKMAALEGPRAAEAEKRASELRLEHFIWE